MLRWLIRAVKGFDNSNLTARRNNAFDVDYEENKDILNGVIFHATLQIRTPLNVLLHHGETYLGKMSEAPVYADIAHGMWLPLVKDEYALDIETTQSSDIGQVTPEAYLPFLLEFRKIVESSSSHQEKLKLLADLSYKKDGFSDIWHQLLNTYEDFPHSFFYTQMTAINGLGVVTAKRLYEAGFTSIESLVQADEDKLLSINGVGKKMVDNINAYRAKS